MWRRLLRLAHPDSGAGDHSLFVWVTALRDHVSRDTVGVGAERTGAGPQQPPGGSHSERLDFTRAFEHASFEDLTGHAVYMSATVGEPFGGLLRLLRSCYAAGVDDVSGYRAQSQGASYRQLAFIAHLSGMTGAERSRWYRICESIPLSQRHAGHLIKELQARGGGYAA